MYNKTKSISFISFPSLPLFAAVNQFYGKKKKLCKLVYSVSWSELQCRSEADAYSCKLHRNFTSRISFDILIINVLCVQNYFAHILKRVWPLRWSDRSFTECKVLNQTAGTHLFWMLFPCMEKKGTWNSFGFLLLATMVKWS